MRVDTNTLAVTKPNAPYAVLPPVGYYPGACIANSCIGARYGANDTNASDWLDTDSDSDAGNFRGDLKKGTGRLVHGTCLQRR